MTRSEFHHLRALLTALGRIADGADEAAAGPPRCQGEWTPRDRECLEVLVRVRATGRESSLGA